MKRKKILLILALLCMAMQGAWAQVADPAVFDDVWDGSTVTRPQFYSSYEGKSNVFVINKAAELVYVRNNWDEPSGVVDGKDFYELNYYLNANLDMNWNVCWIPLGGYSGEKDEFDGQFYGNGHTIRIHIWDATDNYQGLFTIIDDGLVENLHVAGKIECKDSRLVGGICGENWGTIQNCWVSADVSSEWQNSSVAATAKVGGIAGACGNFDEGGGGKMSFCCVTGNVTNNDADVGGILGYFYAGSTDYYVKHSTFLGTRYSTHKQDDICIGDTPGYGQYWALYTDFDQEEYDYAKGYGMYMYCYALDYPFAVNVSEVISVNYARTRAGWTVTLTKTAGSVSSISVKDVDGNTIALNGDETNGWTFTMPKRNVNVTATFTANWPVEGTGTADDPYLISNAREWNEFAWSVYLGNSWNDKHVKLTDNISVTMMAGYYQSDENYKPFSGIFDGGGHTLTLNVSKQSRFAAPFKCVSGATIKNLRTAGTIDGTGNKDGKLLAGIVGVSFGNTTITSCCSSVKLTTNFGEDAAMAGLVAGTKGGSLTIEGCVFDGEMTGTTNTRCAGIAGYEYTATTTTIRNTLFAPRTLTVSTADDSYTKTITRDANATITNCCYTKVLGAAQGVQNIANTTAPDKFGSLVEDYSFVKVYENGLLSDGKYYFKPTTISGTGAEGDPYIIGNTDQWDTFAAMVNSGINNYSGKFVRLDADISVSLMVGSSESNSFQGTFLGNSHTLTFTQGSSESVFNEQYCAPFRFTNGATIRDLKTAGNIYTSAKFAAGLIAHSYGTTTITNCHVGTVIYSSVNGDGTHGGFVAYPDGTVDIAGCAFRGRLLTNNRTNSCGGFVGWHNGQTITVTNSLYAPDSSIPSGWTAINDGATFVRGGEPTITNCYNTELMGMPQGTVAYTFATAPSNLGSLVTNYSMLIAYQNAILCGDTYYVNAILDGSGTAEAPYTISNADEWNRFVIMVNNSNESFSGKYVRLDANITITTTVGLREDHPFSGIFDGNGKTLTANINSTATGTGMNEQGVAPFHYIKGATIKNLTVAGTIASASFHTGGLVGFADGTNTIEDCTVTATLNISSNYAGGIIGHGLESKTTIKNCVFAGTINGVDGNRENIGGIWGWSDSATPTLENCLENGTYTNIASMHPIGLQKDSGTITNCYYVNSQKGSPRNACTNNNALQVLATAPDGEIYKQVRLIDNKDYYVPYTLGGIAGSYDFRDTGSVNISITPTLTDDNGAALVLGTDFTAKLNIEDSSTDVTELPISITVKGTYTLILTGKGSYAGSKSVIILVDGNLKGDGSETTPYLIANNHDWEIFADYVSKGRDYSGKYVRLDADITITTTVGLREDHPFSGIFDGNGKTLTANINSTATGTGMNEQGVAPFHYIKGATIKNLTVAGTIASASFHTGGLVGFADGTNTIEGCTVTATLNISSDYAGGFIGHGLESKTTIKDCVFAGTINGVDGNRENIGGIWGWSDSATPTLENCLEKGIYTNITSMQPMGLQGSSGTITDCYYVNPQVGSPRNACTNNNALQVSATAPDGEVYKQLCLADNNNYYFVYTLGGVAASYDLKAADVSITPTLKGTNVAGLVFGNDFTVKLNGEDVESLPISITENGSYTLTITGMGDYTGSKSVSFTVSGGLGGDGSVETPFIISSMDDWTLFARNVNKGLDYSGKYLMLAENISISTPVGSRVDDNDNQPFSGTFLGNNKTITVTLNNDGRPGLAPFRYINGATIKDLTVAGTITSGWYYTAGLVGFADGTNMIEGCTVTATLNISSNYAGGIIGHGLNSTTTIKNCVFAGTINGGISARSHIGGIWGWSDSATPTLENCLENGTYIKIASMHPIGLQGGSGTITDCYYVNPQKGSPYNACTVSGAVGCYANLSDNAISKKITVNGYTIYSSPCTVSGVDASYYMNNGNVSITPTVKCRNGATLAYGTDFTATLGSDNVTDLPINITQAGDYTLTLTGTGYYAGTKTLTINVRRGLYGAGTTEDPYRISNASDWDVLAEWVLNGFDCSGKYVRLDADFTITTTVGERENHPFSGIFDGNGKTLTANINSTATGTGMNEQGVAPFHYIKGATIKNLTVAGTIASASFHTAGIVGFANGTNTIEGCTVTATLNISSDYAGGIIGHGLNSKTTIKDCVFAGTINGVDGNRENIGGIWGWSNSATPTLENCLENGTYTNIASMRPIGLQSQKVSGTITNCYYLTPQIGSPINNGNTVSGAVQCYAELPDNDLYMVVNVCGATLYVPVNVEMKKRYELTGSTIYPKPKVMTTGGTVISASEYTLTYSGDDTTAGNYTVTVTASESSSTLKGSKKIDYKVYDPSQLEDDGQGGYFVQMPSMETDKDPEEDFAAMRYTIPAGITTFKLYDDGGKDGNYSNYYQGQLTLTAPDGYRLRISGRYILENGCDELRIFDGTEVTNEPKLVLPDSDDSDEMEDLEAYESEGRSLTLAMRTDQSVTFSGFDFTVDVISVDAPWNMAVNAISSTQADVTWEGKDGASYDVKYRKAANVKTIYAADFEQGLPEGWTTFDSDGDGHNWYVNTNEDYAHKSTGSIVSESYCDTEEYEMALTPDNWLISSKLTLKGTLKVWLGTYSEEHFAIYASTTGNTVNAFINSTPLVENTLNGNVSWQEYTVDLSSFGGQEGYIAIRHYDCTDQWIFCVDDFSITEPGDAAGEWQTLSATNVKNATITGLEPNTSYDVQVTSTVGGATYDSRIATFTTLPAISLADNADNSEVIAANNKKVADVILTDRTLYKDGGWNTLCLPFNLVLEGSTLDGATLMELDTDAGTYDHITGLDNGTLYLNFKTATSIEAGKPYLIKWENGDNIVEPVFNGVTISSTAAHEVSFTGGQFIGTYSSVSIEGEKSNIWFVGAKNTLYNPSDASTSLKALRAYFQLTDEVVGGVKSINMNFGEDATGIKRTEDTEKTEATEGVIYNLQGQRLNSLQRGINIIGGKKVLVK